MNDINKATLWHTASVNATDTSTLAKPIIKDILWSVRIDTGNFLEYLLYKLGFRNIARSREQAFPHLTVKYRLLAT